MDSDAEIDVFTGERLLSRCPVIVRRRVAWGECDPAGVVYTPRFADYLAAAYGWFQRTILDEASHDEAGTQFNLPMKAFALEFHNVLRPDTLFDMTVQVADIRNRTFDLVIVGHEPAGSPYFTGRMSPIACGPDFTSIPLPDTARATLLTYQRDCGAPQSPD